MIYTEAKILSNTDFDDNDFDVSRASQQILMQCLERFFSTYKNYNSRKIFFLYILFLVASLNFFIMHSYLLNWQKCFPVD